MVRSWLSWEELYQVIAEVMLLNPPWYCKVQFQTTFLLQPYAAVSISPPPYLFLLLSFPAGLLCLALCAIPFYSAFRILYFAHSSVLHLSTRMSSLVVFHLALWELCAGKQQGCLWDFLVHTDFPRLVFALGVVNVLLTTPLWVVNTRLKLQGAKFRNEDIVPTNYKGIIGEHLLSSNKEELLQ